VPPWKAAPPKDDRGYFERMTTHIFSAGLNWKVVENKAAGFDRAFSGFAPAKVARFTEADVKRLMDDAGIVRNERKIRATVHNAGEFLALKKEYGSFGAYLRHFGKDEAGLQKDLQERFHHLGRSTSRMFLWSVGHPLAPDAEEKKWMAGHKT
jgi:DNA-3-methyladenine glycosylase I